MRVEPRIIGYIAGQPVQGLIDLDTVAQLQHPYAAVLEIAGVRITCDGAALSFGMVPEIPLADWARIRELMLSPDDPIGQLIALAHRWVNTRLDQDGGPSLSER